LFLPGAIPTDIKLNLINRSNKINNPQIVIFQKNGAEGVNAPEDRFDSNVFWSTVALA
jgi:hypothetical protein